MSRFKATIRHAVVGKLVAILLGCVKNLYLWEITLATQDQCTHENQSGSFCGLCGAQLRDPDDDRISGIVGTAVENALLKHGVIKKKPAPGTPPGKKTLADTLGLGKDKK